jgi:hypothetical protein
MNHCEQTYKGWRIFKIADDWARFGPTVAAAELHEREEGNRRPQISGW